MAIAGYLEEDHAPLMHMIAESTREKDSLHLITFTITAWVGRVRLLSKERRQPLNSDCGGGSHHLMRHSITSIPSPHC